MLFPLPFSTFDQVRDLGHSASLYCTGCHRKVPIDLTTRGLRARRSLAVCASPVETSFNAGPPVRPECAARWPASRSTRRPIEW